MVPTCSRKKKTENNGTSPCSSIRFPVKCGQSEILERNFIEQKSMVEYLVGGTFKVFTFQAKNALPVGFFYILNVPFGFLIVPQRTIRNVVF